MASKHWTLYTGVTTELEQRVFQHKTKAFKGFSSKYHCDRLVYFEEFADVSNAIDREKQLKGWRRSKKLDLIRSMNPQLNDLAADLFPQEAIDAVTDLNRKAREELARE